MKRLLLILFLINFSLFGCKMSGSEVSYRELSRSSACGFTKILQPTFNICFDGQQVSANKREELQNMFVRATRTWISAIRDEVPNATDNFAFTCDNNPHLRVTIVSGGTAMARSGHVIKFGVNKEYKVALHELGHAFMCLHDTYLNGEARNCQAGQPQSVMCGNYLTLDSEGYTTLMEDDIAGAKHMISKYGNMIVAGSSNGGVSSKTPTSQQIYVALQGSSNQARLSLSVSPEVASVKLCKGHMSAASCANSYSSIAMSQGGSFANGRKIFNSNYMSNFGSTYTAVSINSQNSVILSRVFTITR